MVIDGDSCLELGPRLVPRVLQQVIAPELLSTDVSQVLVQEDDLSTLKLLSFENKYLTVRPVCRLVSFRLL